MSDYGYNDSDECADGISTERINRVFKSRIKKVDPKTVQERCYKCKKKSRRMDMGHMQMGFQAYWFCKDKAGCAKRQKIK